MTASPSALQLCFITHPDISPYNTYTSKTYSSSLHQATSCHIIKTNHNDNDYTPTRLPTVQRYNSRRHSFNGHHLQRAQHVDSESSSLPGPTTNPPSASNPLPNEIDGLTSIHPTFVLFESTLASAQFFDIDILHPHYYSNTHSPPNTAHPLMPLGTYVAQLGWRAAIMQHSHV
jgi:hypothetical protein